MCKQCIDKKWLPKTFTLIAKRKMNKRSKNNDQNETELGENSVVDMNENNNDIEDNDIDNDTHEEENESDEEIVESDLVVG